MRQSLAVALFVALGCDLGACSSFEEGAGAPGADASAAPDGSTADPPDAASEDAPQTTSKFVYVFGGVSDASGSESARAAYRARIEAGGSLGAWEPAPALDTGRDYAALAMTSTGAVVFAGGHHFPLGGERQTYVDSIDTASLDPLAPWAAAPTLPAGRITSGAVAIGSYVYVAGGQAPALAFHDEIWGASVESGTLSPWQPAGTLPAPMATHAMVALGTRVYVVGGGAVLDGGIEYAPVTMMGTVEAGGALGGWKESGALPTRVVSPAAVAVGLRVFVIGGGAHPDSHPTDAVSVGTQSEDGSLTWAASAPLPGKTWLACAAASNDVIYVMGGYPALEQPATPSVFVGHVSPNGGVSWTTSAPMPLARAAGGCVIR